MRGRKYKRKGGISRGRRRRKEEGMPSIRVARLCKLKQKEVHQPISVHHAHASHAKRVRRCRQGMPSCTSCTPCITILSPNRRMGNQHFEPLCPHHQNLCSFPFIKQHLRHLSKGVRSPHTHTEFPSGRMHAGYCENPSDDVHDESVGTYRRLGSFKGRCGDAQFEDDSKVFDSGPIENRHFGCEMINSEGTAMLVDCTSAVLPCLDGLAAAAKHEHQPLNLKPERNRTPDTVSYTKGMRNKPNTNVDDELHPKPKRNGPPNTVSYTKGMCNKPDTPVDDVLHDYELCNRNVLAAQKHDQKHYSTCAQYPTWSTDLNHSAPLWQSLFSSDQKASFLDGRIFYDKPKTRVRVRGASNSETYSVDIHERTAKNQRRLNRKGNANVRKVSFDNSHDSATRILLPSHNRSGLSNQSSPLKSSVGLLHDSPTSHLEGQSLDELERFALHESTETTQVIKNCLRVAENMNNDVASSLNALYQQGEQTRVAHQYTLGIDHNLSEGERILGSFGGIFSKTWKPVKTRAINGPESVDQSHYLSKEKNHSDKVVSHSAVGKNYTAKYHSELLVQMQLPRQVKAEILRQEQDEALTDLSSMVSKLKKMSLDMGNELSRQSEALDPFQDEVIELTQRLKRANMRGRFLLVQ